MRLLSGVALMAVGPFVLLRLIAARAIHFTGVAKDFPPFRTLPLLSGVFGGCICAPAVYALITRTEGLPR